MDRSDLRPLVFDVLRKTPQTHFRAVENDVRRAADDYERRDVLALNEVLWELLVQGVLAPGKNSLNPDLPFVHVTEYGARCLEDGEVVPHDPDRYVERMIAKTDGAASPVVVESAREGLLSFLAGRHAAAVVLLAHAAESLLDALTDALIASGRRTGRGTKQLASSRGTFARQSRAVRRALLRWDPPAEVASEAETHLAGLEALVRLVRSDEGSPRTPFVNRDATLAHFLLFPDRCRFVYHATDWLAGKPDA